MKLNIPQSRRKPRVVGSIRQTQLITTFGCGAIVDLIDASVIIGGTNFWKHVDNPDYQLNEVNLERMLGIKYFVKPKMEDKVENTFVKSRDIPAFNFPETFICQKCGRVDSYKNFKLGNKLKCKCNGNTIIPSRFVIACTNGHIEDFPYGWWVHRGDSDSCKNHDIRMFQNTDTGGLESIVIYCKSCKSARTMAGSVSRNAFAGYKCKGNRPWLRDYDKNQCNEVMRTVQRGSTNIYFPQHASSLSIPPWSDKVQKKLNDIARLLTDVKPDDDLMIYHLIKTYNLANKLNCTENEVAEQIYIRLKAINEPMKITANEVLYDEYRAFMQGINNFEDFQTYEEEVPSSLDEYIDKLILAPKLREVMALVGFRRIKPLDENAVDDGNYSPISNKKMEWLPAIELNGEGIFIKFNEEKLQQWERKATVQRRIKIMADNMKENGLNYAKFSIRYVLLHTIAHLLIHQLVLECGYSTSSLKEKIYSSFTDDKKTYTMSGILIYTATPDSEGSLGGLVYQGGTERLEKMFLDMLDKASWCSSDPICIQSRGQGLNSLNLAACHSCTLLPETSCEYRNLLLDRGTVVGSLEEKEIGFFNELLNC